MPARTQIGSEALETGVRQAAAVTHRRPRSDSNGRALTYQPCSIRGFRQGILGLGDQAGPHAGDRQGRVAEGISGLQLAGAAGMPNRLFMPLEPGAPGPQSRMGQGKLRLLGHKGFSAATAPARSPDILDVFRFGVAILPSSSPVCHIRVLQVPPV